MSNDIVVTYGTKAMKDPDYAVEKAVGSWQAARKATQVACVSILAALYRHNDGETAMRRATTLVDGSVGANQKAIVEWFVKMGFLVGEEGFVGTPSKTVIENLAGKGFKLAKELHWWTLKPVNPFEGYSLEAARDQLVKRAEKMLKLATEDEGAADKININIDMLEAIKAA